MAITIPNSLIQSISIQGGKVAKTLTSKPITTQTAKATNSIFTSIQSFFKGTSTGNKLVKTGIGIGVVGGGIAVGTSLATPTIVESGNQVSKGFGIPMELIFIIGAILLVLVLVGGKRR